MTLYRFLWALSVDRWFVLLPNYLLQYFENADAYQIGIQPKGSIDLTLATKILVYDKQSNGSLRCVI